MTNVTRQIVGYDPTTERVAFEREIPSDKWRDVLSLVRHNENDPDHIYDYRINAGVAEHIMGVIGEPLVAGLHYVLECEAAG